MRLLDQLFSSHLHDDEAFEFDYEKLLIMKRVKWWEADETMLKFLLLDKILLSFRFDENQNWLLDFVKLQFHIVLSREREKEL